MLCSKSIASNDVWYILKRLKTQSFLAPVLSQEPGVRWLLFVDVVNNFFLFPCFLDGLDCCFF